MAQTTQTMTQTSNTLDASAIRHHTPPVHTHEPKKDVRLVFSNYTNTEYEVVEDDLQVPTFNETYADVFKRGLDPNIKDNQVYGFATPLKPKTALINQMRADIEKANADLFCLIDDENKRIAELEKNSQSSDQSTPTQDPTPQGGND